MTCPAQARARTARPTGRLDGWLVVDVREAEETFRQFGETLMPILRDLGVPDVRPRRRPAFNVVTR
ncbi:hypothetical protein AB0L50_37655 [Streptomyces flaveolus]|uniref:hypothetical protein n=1 Tax=Streptomyces flaveolus TaxID=67297 RepID=UPI0034175A13